MFDTTLSRHDHLPAGHCVKKGVWISTESLGSTFLPVLTENRLTPEQYPIPGLFPDDANLPTSTTSLGREQSGTPLTTELLRI